MITLYDLPSEKLGTAWSPNTWKARYALNIKNLPHKTVWVDYIDLKGLYEKLGIPNISTRPDGSPLYTLPVIQDDTTNAIISESIDIIAYLDKTYPETTTLIPKGSWVLQKAFETVFLSTIGSSAPIMYPATYEFINPKSQDYFFRTKGVGKYNDPELKTEAWKKFEKELGVIDGWLSNNGHAQKYVAGNSITFADVVLAGRLHYMRCILGEGSEEWKRIAGWHGGRWGTYMVEFRQYDTVHI